MGTGVLPRHSSRTKQRGPGWRAAWRWLVSYPLCPRWRVGESARALQHDLQFGKLVVTFVIAALGDEAARLGEVRPRLLGRAGRLGSIRQGRLRRAIFDEPIERR